MDSVFIIDAVSVMLERHPRSLKPWFEVGAAPVPDRIPFYICIRQVAAYRIVKTVQRQPVEVFVCVGAPILDIRAKHFPATAARCTKTIRRLAAVCVSSINVPASYRRTRNL